MNAQINNSFTFQLYNLSFPQSKEKEWRELFRPCASQRLFLPVSNFSRQIGIISLELQSIV